MQEFVPPTEPVQEHLHDVEITFQQSMCQKPGKQIQTIVPSILPKGVAMAMMCIAHTGSHKQ